MTLDAERIDQPVEDPVSNALKWVLLLVAILTFALLAWATVVTYRTAPPQPDRFVTASGTVVMTGADIFSRQGRLPKGRPDGLWQPLRHGLLFRRGLHRRNLVRLGSPTRTTSPRADGQAFAGLTADQQAAATRGRCSARCRGST